MLYYGPSPQGPPPYPTTSSRQSISPPPPFHWKALCHQPQAVQQALLLTPGFPHLLNLPMAPLPEELSISPCQPYSCVRAHPKSPSWVLRLGSSPAHDHRSRLSWGTLSSEVLGPHHQSATDSGIPAPCFPFGFPVILAAPHDCSRAGSSTPHPSLAGLRTNIPQRHPGHLTWSPWLSLTWTPILCGAGLAWN